LPWSTANEDLVELFETTGQVEQAEILYDGTRSKGAGVVQFTHVEEAETAISKSECTTFYNWVTDEDLSDHLEQPNSVVTCMVEDRSVSS
jgi:hypothetical protein